MLAFEMVHSLMGGRMIKRVINNTNRFFGALVLTIVCLGGFNPASGFASTQTLTVLGRSELHEAMAFHDGFLWVGKSRTQMGSINNLEIYNREHQKVESLTLSHSLTYITPYGPHSVVVVGTASKPNLTHYTIVENRNGRFFLRDRTIEVGWANHWIGSLGGREYFTDMGGNPDDPEASEHPTIPAQTFFSVGASGLAKYLPVRLRMPFGGVRVGSAFYVLQGQGIGNPRTNLVRLNVASNSVQPLFPSYRNDLTKIIEIPGSNMVAVNESGAGQLLVVDVQKSTLLSTTPVGGSLRSLTSMGRCILVASDEARTITAVDIRQPSQTKVVGVVPINLDSNSFKMLNKIVADSQSGRLYARSNFPCNPMITVCDKDFNRVVYFEGTEAEKVANSCR